MRRLLSMLLFLALLSVGAALGEATLSPAPDAALFSCDVFTAQLPQGMSAIYDGAQVGYSEAAQADAALSWEQSLMIARAGDGTSALSVVQTDSADAPALTAALAEALPQADVSEISLLPISAGEVEVFTVTLEGAVYTQAVLAGKDTCLIVTAVGLDEVALTAFLDSVRFV